MPVVPTSQTYSVPLEQVQAPKMDANAFGGRIAQQTEKAGEAGLKLGDSLQLLNYYANRANAREEMNQTKAQSSAMVNKILNDPTALDKVNAAGQLDPHGQFRGLVDYHKGVTEGLIAPAQKKYANSPEQMQMFTDYTQRVINEDDIKLVKGLGGLAYKKEGAQLEASMSLDMMNPENMKQHFADAAQHYNYNPEQAQAAQNSFYIKHANTLSPEQIPAYLKAAKVYMSDEAYQGLEAREMAKVNTADGKVAKTDGKALLDTFNNQIQKNPNFIYTTSRDNLIEQTKDVPLDTQTKLLESYDKIRAGVPPTEAGKMLKEYMINENKFNDATLKAQGTTAPVDRNIRDTDDANKFQYVYQQLNNLSYEQQMDRKVQEDLVKKAETPGVYVNAQGVPETMKPYQRAFSKEPLFDKNNETQLQALKQ